MDIRKFFGVIPSGKKLVTETVKKNEKTKSDEETLKAKKGIKEIKVNSSRKEDDFKQKQPSKKKRIIYDSDSESEETLQVKMPKSNQKNRQYLLNLVKFHGRILLHTFQKQMKKMTLCVRRRPLNQKRMEDLQIVILEHQT